MLGVGIRICLHACVSVFKLLVMNWNFLLLLKSFFFFFFPYNVFLYVHAQSLNPVQLFVTPCTIACQAPLSMEFSWQEYWSRLPFPTSGNLRTQGANPSLLHLLHLARGFFTTSATWVPLTRKVKFP